MRISDWSSDVCASELISIATVYRTVKLFEEASILERHDFGDGRARYEERPEEHHDHLIDVKTGEVVEFSNEEIERLQAEVARTLGYRLDDHRLELFGVRLDGKRKDRGEPEGNADRKSTRLNSRH